MLKSEATFQHLALVSSSKAKFTMKVDSTFIDFALGLRRPASRGSPLPEREAAFRLNATFKASKMGPCTGCPVPSGRGH